MPKKQPIEIDYILGRRIRKAREKFGFTLVSLGKKIKLSHNAVAKYERGAVPLTVSRLVTIANALDMPLWWFLRGFGNNKGHEPKRQPADLGVLEKPTADGS